MERIKKAENREKTLILLGLTALALVGLGLLFLFYNKNIFLLLLGLSVTILAIKLIYDQFSGSGKEEFTLTNLLLEKPEKVVWVYSIVTQRMPFGFEINQTGTMYFKMIDGTEKTVVLPAKELKEISEMLNIRLPHATFGYTKEREQWFLAHPELLIKSE